MFRYWSIT